MTDTGDIFAKAVFATTQEDLASLALDLADAITETNGAFSLDLGACVSSLSLAKLTVAGLPTGLKYDAKTMTISGKATKPGLYAVKVTATNASATGKKAVVGQFTIEVPNFTAANEYFVDDLYNDVGEKYTLSVGISNIDDFLPSLELNNATVKLAVSGLPSGLKYDAKTGRITGIATKPGTYTVTLTVTDGKAKYVSTIMVEVEPLPDWVVGTFYGKEIAHGTGYYEWVCPMQITVTISAVGKISIKGIEPGESGASRSAQLTEVRDDGSYAFTVHHVSGRKGNDGYTEGDLEGVITPMVYGDNIEFGCCIIHDVGVCDEDDDPYESDGEAYQSLYSSKSHVSKLPVFVKNAVTTVNMNYMRDDDWDPYYGGYLTLKYGANGAVTTAYSETVGGKATATGSAQLVPYEVDGDTVRAWLYTALKPKGREPFGVLLSLSIDTSRGIVYGSDVSCDDYLLEVDD
jgi:PKD repeat protein